MITLPWEWILTIQNPIGSFRFGFPGLDLIWTWMSIRLQVHITMDFGLYIKKTNGCPNKYWTAQRWLCRCPKVLEDAAARAAGRAPASQPPRPCLVSIDAVLTLAFPGSSADDDLAEAYPRRPRQGQAASTARAPPRPATMPCWLLQ